MQGKVAPFAGVGTGYITGWVYGAVAQAYGWPEMPPEVAAAIGAAFYSGILYAKGAIDRWLERERGMI